MLLQDFKMAIERLNEALKMEKNPIVRDSAIKRFEFCFDLAWKCIKGFAQKEGSECYSPRSCFQTAFQLHLIDYDDLWLKMLDDRNTATHLYSEDLANEVYSHLPNYLNLFQKLVFKLESLSK